MILSLIVARDQGGVIGKEGRLPWHLPRDLAHFKKLTMGKPIIMGRLTYESIGRPLPGRMSIVISGRRTLRIEGVSVVGSLEDALALARESGAEEAFVIGGARVYREALPVADKVYLTEVHARHEGDVFFPALRSEDWELEDEEEVAADERNPHPLVFKVFRRRRPA